MNQTNNRIREEWEKGLEDIIYDSYQIIDSNGRGFENVKWFIDELLKSQREDWVEKIEKHENFITMSDYDVGYNDCKENIINLIKEDK